MNVARIGRRDSAFSGIKTQLQNSSNLLLSKKKISPWTTAFSQVGLFLIASYAVLMDYHYITTTGPC